MHGFSTSVALMPCLSSALAGVQLLATMGYRGAGHGLGRQQHGIEHALQARRLKPGAGLGVDGGKGVEEGGAAGPGVWLAICWCLSGQQQAP